jgi:hypothetical protein
MQQGWNRLRWRERFIWRVERACYGAKPSYAAAENEPVAFCRASAPPQDLLERASRSRSTADSIAAAQEILARVRALSAGDVNNMMFTVRYRRGHRYRSAARFVRAVRKRRYARQRRERGALAPLDPGGGAEALNGAGMGHALADVQPSAARADSTAYNRCAHLPGW